MNAMKRFAAILCLFMFFSLLNAQNQSFTQTKAQDAYINPSLIGKAINGRLSVGYRNQWPGIANLQSYYVTAEKYFEKIKSGMGFQVMSYASSKVDKSYFPRVYYAYNLQVGEMSYVRFGLAGGVGIYDYGDNVILPGDIVGEGHEYVPDSTTVKADFSVGMSLNIGEHTTIGIGGNHVTSFGQGRTPFVLSLYYSDKIAIDDNDFISPTVLYQYQGSFDYLNLCATWNHSLMNVGIGYNLHVYRFNVDNIHAGVLLFGLNFSNIDVTYSLDVPFGGIGLKSFGAHEIVVRYDF